MCSRKNVLSAPEPSQEGKTALLSDEVVHSIIDFMNCIETASGSASVGGWAAGEVAVEWWMWLLDGVRQPRRRRRIDDVCSSIILCRCQF